MRVASVASASLLMFAVGCGSTGRGLLDTDPSYKVPAIKQAVANDQMSAAPELIRSLDDDDSAVRFYAIQGLQRLTKETFGYNYYDDAPTRRPAVVRWQQWLNEHRP